jgi:hypothetical protein
LGGQTVKVLWVGRAGFGFVWRGVEHQFYRDLDGSMKKRWTHYSFDGVACLEVGVREFDFLRPPVGWGNPDSDPVQDIRDWMRTEHERGL